jgi:hypothetical protein
LLCVPISNLLAGSIGRGRNDLYKDRANSRTSGKRLNYFNLPRRPEAACIWIGLLCAAQFYRICIIFRRA